jgi:hypothetical protein
VAITSLFPSWQEFWTRGGPPDADVAPPAPFDEFIKRLRGDAAPPKLQGALSGTAASIEGRRHGDGMGRNARRGFVGALTAGVAAGGAMAAGGAAAGQAAGLGTPAAVTPPWTRSTSMMRPGSPSSCAAVASARRSCWTARSRASSASTPWSTP